MSSVKEIADRLVALCREGQYETAQKELYAKDAVNLEPEGAPMPGVKGLDAIIEKGHQFGAGVEEIHSNFVSDPLIAGDHFSVSAIMDLTMKGMGRVKMEEVCVYEVKDGKIVKEQFFYSM